MSIDFEHFEGKQGKNRNSEPSAPKVEPQEVCFNCSKPVKQIENGWIHVDANDFTRCHFQGLPASKYDKEGKPRPTQATETASAPQDFKMKVSCMICDKPFVDGKHDCSIRLTELEHELIGVMAAVSFCDHYCCGMTDVLCKTKQLLLALERHELKLVPAAAPSVAGTQPTEMYVCEIAHLVLHPEQLYRFHIHPDCKGCKDYSGAAQGTPQVETKPVIYTVHLPSAKHLMTADRLNTFLNSDKALQYQDCQIKITVERVK
jgi:hypothetical protein